MGCVVTSKRLKLPPVGAGWPTATTSRRLAGAGAAVGLVVGLGAFDRIAQMAAAHISSTGSAASATRSRAPFSRRPANGEGTRSVLHEAGFDRRDVVADHLDVGVGLAAGFRQGIAVQRAADLRPGLLRDPLHGPRVGDA